MEAALELVALLNARGYRIRVPRAIVAPRVSKGTSYSFVQYFWNPM